MAPAPSPAQPMSVSPAARSSEFRYVHKMVRVSFGLHTRVYGIKQLRRSQLAHGRPFAGSTTHRERESFHNKLVVTCPAIAMGPSMTKMGHGTHALLLRAQSISSRIPQALIVVMGSTNPAQLAFAHNETTLLNQFGSSAVSRMCQA